MPLLWAGGKDDRWRMFMALARASFTQHVLSKTAEYPARTRVHQVPTSLVLDGPRLSWKWELGVELRAR